MEELRLLYQCQQLDIQQGKNQLSFQGRGGQLIETLGQLGIKPLLRVLVVLPAQALA